MRHKTSLVGLLLASVLFGASPVQAGIVKKDIDFIFITPTLGVEVDRFFFLKSNFTAIGALTNTLITSYDQTAVGLSAGAQAGMRFGPIGFFVDYQRTWNLKLDPVIDKLYFDQHKLYLGVAFCTRSDFMVTNFRVEFGWTRLDMSNQSDFDGWGGKLGVGIDFYPLKWLSIGPQIDFDGQGYNPPTGGIAGAVGGTFALRLGFHI